MGDRVGIATTLGNIAAIHGLLGDPRRALACQEQALKLSEELGDRAAAASSLANIGTLHSLLGDHRRALAYEERALSLREELGDRPGVASSLLYIARIHRLIGDDAKALAYHERALAVAESLGLLEVEFRSLLGIAQSHLSSGRAREAASHARKAVERMAGLVSGLSEEQGAGVRQQFVSVFEVGARAAIEAGDAAEALFFLESGRAGALHEALRARDALWAATLPEELRREELGARGAESAAAASLRKAVDSRNREEILSRRKELDEARARVLEVIGRVQREAKAVASVLYPSAASLPSIRDDLGEDEVLLLYGLFSEEAVALVVTREGARAVRLGQAAELEAACAALAIDGPEAEPQAARLAALAIEPLRLGTKAKRLLVSPDRALAYVPFALLAPEREIAYVPSGTIYGLLREERAERGDGVLALGDPDDATRPDPNAVTVMRGGLGRLAGTREEARAFGDVVLLGSDATETGLRDALGKRARWRSVHLACHGLLDAERPMFSSLALTPSADEDGFLTALEVFRMKIPADLAVLSACETGKGKIVKGEGVIGLTRAFMFAGAPRVIVSLWQVDDEATRALMVKFYELWKPASAGASAGKPGMGAAAALRAAQEHVRSQEKWKHPYYWAAWQLWGLPD